MTMEKGLNHIPCFISQQQLQQLVRTYNTFIMSYIIQFFHLPIKVVASD